MDIYEKYSESQNFNQTTVSMNSMKIHNNA